MKKLFDKILAETFKDKKVYVFLFIILTIGLIFGSLYINLLDEQDKSEVLNQIVLFFKQIKNNEIDHITVLKNSLSSNLIYLFFIWILGISVIGIPIIIFLVFIKGFIIGFSVISIIVKYKFLGVLGAFTYIFPHIIINAFVILIISCYALKLSIDIFWTIIQRKTFNFKNVINRYCFIMLISMVILIASSLIEVYVSPYIIKFFLLFVKI